MSKQAIALLASLTAALSLAWATTRSTQDGVFTSAQAERGRVVYERACKNCHQEDFYRERLAKFANQSVATLFEAVATTMPADNVGSLPSSEYLDVLAYVFSITGSPAGASELTTDNMEAVAIAPLK